MLKALEYGLTGLFLIIDGIIYWLLSLLFSLYAKLAGAEIIKESFFSEMMDRVYVIIGVFMLFVVAYSLLKSLINPDNLSKDTGKIVTNVIISIVLLGIVPVIFSYARDLQSIIIEENIIGNILFNDNTQDIANTGNNIALQVLLAFIDMDDDVVGHLRPPEEGDSENSIVDDVKDWLESDGEGSVTWGQLKEVIRQGHIKNFMKITYFAEPIHEEQGNSFYIPMVSAVCGLFLVYVVLSFCLDLGVRVVKLAFYQIIAPVPILLRIIPEKKSVFDNWVKATIATYMEVFIRIFIIMLVGALCVGIFEGDFLQLKNISEYLGGYVLWIK